MDFNDVMLWLSIVGLFVILLALLVNHRKKKVKDSKTMPLSFTFAVILILFSVIILMPYAINKSSGTLGIVTNVVAASIGVGVISATFYIFGKIELFDSKVAISRLELSVRIFFLLLYYLLFSIVIGTGINFLFNGLISSQVATLTPEFENLVIPTMTLTVLILFRVTNVFSTRILSVFKAVVKDIIVFSFLMFWLSVVALPVGITLQTNLIQGSGNGLLILMLTFLGIAIEILSLQVKQDTKILSKRNPTLSIEDLIKNVFLSFRRNQSHQKLIADYTKTEPEKKRDPSLIKLENIIESRFNIKYRGKVLKASTIISIGLLLLVISGLFVILPATIHNQTVIAPAYSVSLQIVPKDKLTSNYTQILSDDIASISPDESYAIPIVNVNTSNISFTAPLSNRLRSLNSPSYMVSEENSFLTISFEKIIVQTTNRFISIKDVNYNQTNNPAYDYIGFYRDAEIYYEIAKLGYNQTKTFSISSSPNMDETIRQKWITASNSNSTISIFINKDIPLSDSTIIYSQNPKFTDEAVFLISQTKVTTIVNSSDISYMLPFTIYSHSKG